MKRSEAREKIFRIIFQMEFYDDFDKIYERLYHEEELKGVQGEYALATIKEIIEKKDIIDSIISEYLKGWKFERLPKTVIALLRLGVYELKFNESVPDITAIDEAVTLAYEYCDEKDSVFINGVLNNIYTDGKK